MNVVWTSMDWQPDVIKILLFPTIHYVKPGLIFCLYCALVVGAFDAPQNRGISKFPCPWLSSKARYQRIPPVVDPDFCITHQIFVHWTKLYVSPPETLAKPGQSIMSDLTQLSFSVGKLRALVNEARGIYARYIDPTEKKSVTNYWKTQTRTLWPTAWNH